MFTIASCVHSFLFIKIVHLFQPKLFPDNKLHVEKTVLLSVFASFAQCFPKCSPSDSWKHLVSFANDLPCSTAIYLTRQHRIKGPL